MTHIEIDQLHDSSPWRCATPPGPVGGMGYCWGENCNSTALNNTQRQRSNERKPAWCPDCIGSKQLPVLHDPTLTPSKTFVSGFKWNCSVDDLANWLTSGANPNEVSYIQAVGLRPKRIGLRGLLLLVADFDDLVYLWNADGTPQRCPKNMNIIITPLFLVIYSMPMVPLLPASHWLQCIRLLVSAGADVTPAIPIAEQQLEELTLRFESDPGRVEILQLLYGERTRIRTHVFKEELIARALHPARIDAWLAAGVTIEEL